MPFSKHNYNTCWRLSILTWVNVPLQEQLGALPALWRFSQQKAIPPALLCHLLWSILLGNIINVTAPLREKPVPIHCTGTVPRCQALLSLAANIPFQSDFSLEGIVMGSRCAYPCLSTQRPLFNLSGNFYLNTTDGSLTGT